MCLYLQMIGNFIGTLLCCIFLRESDCCSVKPCFISLFYVYFLSRYSYRRGCSESRFPESLVVNSSTASPGNGLDESDNARFLRTSVGGEQSFVSSRPVNAHNFVTACLLVNEPTLKPGELDRVKSITVVQR